MSDTSLFPLILRIPEDLAPPVMIIARTARDGMVLAEGDPILRIRDANGRGGFLRAPAAGTVQYEPTAIPGAERPVSATVATLTRAQSQPSGAGAGSPAAASEAGHPSSTAAPTVSPAARPMETPSGSADQSPNAQAQPGPEPTQPANPSRCPGAAEPEDVLSDTRPPVWKGALGWGLLIGLIMGALSIDFEGFEIFFMILWMLIVALVAFVVLVVFSIGARIGSVRARIVGLLAFFVVPGFAGFVAALEATSSTPNGLLPSLIADYAVDDKGRWKLPWTEPEQDREPVSAQRQTRREAQEQVQAQRTTERTAAAPSRPRCEATFRSGDFGVEAKVQRAFGLSSDMVDFGLRNERQTDPQPAPAPLTLKSRITIENGPYEIEFYFLKGSPEPYTASLSFWAGPGERPLRFPSGGEDVREFTIRVLIDGFEYGRDRRLRLVPRMYRDLYAVTFEEVVGLDLQDWDERRRAARANRSRIEGMDAPRDERASAFANFLTTGRTLEIVVDAKMQNQGAGTVTTRDTVSLNGAEQALSEAHRRLAALRADARANRCISAFFR